MPQENDFQSQLHSFIAGRRALLSPTPKSTTPKRPIKQPTPAMSAPPATAPTTPAAEPSDFKNQLSSFVSSRRSPIPSGRMITDPQGKQYDVDATARKYGLDPNIIYKQIMQESSGRHDAVSPKGAIGFMQLMPETAKRLGVDPHDPQQNLDGGMREMQRLVQKYGGDYHKALAAYNAGEERVDELGRIPDYPETQNYVNKIMGGQDAAYKPRPAPMSMLGPGQRISIPEPYQRGVPGGVRAYFDQHPDLRSSPQGQEMLEDLSHQADLAKQDPHWGEQSWWMDSVNRYLVDPFDKTIYQAVEKGLDRNKQFKEQYRLASHQLFDRALGRQVSIEEEARRHPQGPTAKIFQALGDKADSIAAHMITDPRQLVLMFAGQAEGVAGLKGAAGLFRTGADAGFAAMQGYGAYQGAMGAYQKFKDGDYVNGSADMLGAAVDGAFATMGAVSAIHKVRAMGTLSTLDAVAKHDYGGREWGDLPQAQRNDVAAQVLKANQSRAPFLEELQNAENNRDLVAIKQAYEKMTGQKFPVPTPKGVKPAPLGRVEEDLKVYQEAYLEHQLGIRQTPRDYVETDWEKSHNQNTEDIIQMKQQGDQELSSGERDYQGQRQKALEALQNIPVEETGRFSDQSFRAWADSRTKESYGANEKDIKAYSELAEGLIRRGWLEETKALLTRAKYVLGEPSDVEKLGYTEEQSRQLAEQNKALNEKLFKTQQDARDLMEQVEPAWHEILAQEVEVQRQVEEEATRRTEEEMTQARVELEHEELARRQQLDLEREKTGLAMQVAPKPGALAAPKPTGPPPPLPGPEIRLGLQPTPRPALGEGMGAIPKPPGSTEPPPILGGADARLTPPPTGTEGRPEPARAPLERAATSPRLLPGEESYLLDNLVQKAAEARKQAARARKTYYQKLGRQIDKAMAGDEYTRRKKQDAELSKQDKEAGFKDLGRTKLEEKPSVLPISPEDADKARQERYAINMLDEAMRSIQEQRDDVQEALPKATPAEVPHLEKAVEAAEKEIKDLGKQRDAMEAEMPKELRKDPERDRPAVEIPQKRLGNNTEIKTARGSTIAVQYAVVDARQIEPSHDSELNPNPNYPARRQPRNRNRAFSKDQFLKIAANFDPAMLGENFSGNNGAPVVGDDLYVDGGNMRSIVLKFLYQLKDKKADEYKAWLASNASKFGVAPEIVAQMPQPMLVRVRRTPLESIGSSPEAFSRELNEPFEASMSSVETARADAQTMAPDLLSILQPGEDGNLFTATNQGFVQRFFNEVISPADRSKYMMANGQINQDGVRRIQSAIFAKAFPGSEALLEKLSEDPDNNIRNATKAMLAAAPKFAQLSQLVEEGTLHDLRLSDDVVEAARKLSSLREQGQSVSDYLNQGKMYGEDISPAARELLTILSKNARRPANVADILNTYAEDAMRAGRKDQGNMFGGAGEAPDKAALLRGAMNAVAGPSLLGEEAAGPGTPPPPLEAAKTPNLESPPEPVAPKEGTIAPETGAVPPPLAGADEAARGKLKKDLGARNKAVEGKMAPPPGDEGFLKKSEADKRIARLKGKFGRLQAGVDPQDLADIAYVMGHYVERGIRDFAAVAKKTLEDLGEWAKPHLEAAWAMVPRVAREAGQMDLFGEVKGGTETAAKGGLSDAPPPLQDVKRTGKAVSEGAAAQPTGAGGPAGAGLPGAGGTPAAGRQRRVRSEGLRDVKPAELEPQRERVKPPSWKEDEWKKVVDDARLPPNARIPTQRVYQHIADKLIFPGQGAIADFALSELLDGSGGVVLGLPTGTGKSYLGSAIVRHLQESAPDQFKNILYITANQKLVDDWVNIAKGFGIEADKNHYRDNPQAVGKPPKPGVYAVGFDTAKNRKGIESFPWDLVLVDEAGQARGGEKSQRGNLISEMGTNAKKMAYLSATPFTNASELQYLTRLNLWKRGGFDKWVEQFGIRRDAQGVWTGHTVPFKLEKLRQQLVERGQLINQEKNFDGFNAHFAVVPLTPEQVQGVKNIDRAFAAARDYYQRRGNRTGMMNVSMTKMNYLKHYIESTRIPATIEMARRAMKAGYQVPIFSETHSEVSELYKPLEQPNAAMNGYIETLLPKIPGFVPALKEAFGEDFADYSGGYSSKREKQLEAFQGGQKKVFYTTYAAGGMGLSIHDTAGDAPRFSIYHGLPWSGYFFEQAAGRTWRYGTKSDTNAAFLLSNAAPEVRLVVSRIVPRLDALNAVVNGVNFENPITKGLSNANEALGYEHGDTLKSNGKEFTDLLDVSKVFKTHKQIDIADAKSQIGPNKGMKVRPRGEPPPNLAGKSPSKGPQAPSRGTLFAGVDPVEAARRVSKELKDTFHRDSGIKSDPVLDKIIHERFNELALKRLNPTLPKAEDKQRFVSNVASIAGDQAARTDGNPAPIVDSVLKDSTEWVKDHTGRAGAQVYKFAQEGQEGSSTLFKFGLKNGSEIINAAAKKANMPELGKEIDSDKSEYWAQRALIGGHWNGRLMDWINKYKITDEILDRGGLWDMKEGNKEIPKGSWQEGAVKDLQQLFYDVQDRLVKEGVQIKRYNRITEKAESFDFPREKRPDYMPRVYDEEVFHFGSKKRDQIIAGIMSREQVSKELAEKLLDSRQLRDVPLAGNVERARENNIEGYEKTIPALYRYLGGASEAAARTNVLGQEAEKLYGKLGALPETQRRQIRDLFDTMLRHNPFYEGPKSIINAASDYVAVSKMTFSVLPMMSHSIRSMMFDPSAMVEFARSFKQILSDYPAANRAAIESGAMTPSKTLDFIQSEYKVKGGSVGDWVLGKVGVKSVDHFSRVMANSIAENFMTHRALPKLMDDAQHAYRHIVRDTFGVPDKLIDQAVKDGRWSDEAINRAGARWAKETQGSMDPTELPPLWKLRPKNEAEQVLAAMFRVGVLLKGQVYRGGKFYSKFVMNEMLKGNIRPLIPFLLVGQAAGEVLNDLNELKNGRTDRLKQLFQGETYTHPMTLLGRIADNYGHVVASSLYSQAILSLANFKGIDPADALNRLVLGPVYGDASEIVGRTYFAAKDFSEDEVDKGITQLKALGRAIVPASRLIPGMAPTPRSVGGGGGGGEYGLGSVPREF